MSQPELKCLDDYEVLLTEKLASWSPQHRVALAAGLAERWLPAYESFSSEEEWGDPASLCRSLDALWGHILGRGLGASDIARHIQQIEEITPHLDDFDAEEALTACAILNDALRSCGEPRRAISHILGSATGAFECLVEDWPVELSAQRRVWKSRVVRHELQAQLQLIEAIDAVATFDADAVKGLRRRIAELKVKPTSPPEPKGPVGLTNQVMFEQYRRYVESDLKGRVKGEAEPEPGSFLFAVTYLGYWMGRYSRRMQSLNGGYGRLADELGQRAVVARNRAVDAQALGPLAWEDEVREAIEMCLQNNRQMSNLDAGTIETAHGYGPSLRRLWLEGRRRGPTNQDGWNHVRAWATHAPTAWATEDRRKKSGRVHSISQLGDLLARPLTWTTSSDPFHPWSSEVEGTTWRIRINDFPDELMYTLIIGNESAGDFHDWPENWQRSSATGQ